MGHFTKPLSNKVIQILYLPLSALIYFLILYCDFSYAQIIKERNNGSGRFLQSNWVQLNSPCGGKINIIFKVTDTIFLAGIQNESIYRSSDAGENWIKIFQGSHTSSAKGIRSFVLNSCEEILVGTYTNGIMRSTDLGLTWYNTNCSGGENIVNTTSGFMLSSDNVNVDWSLAKSLDSGKTWISIPKPDPWWHIFSLASFNNIIYAPMDFGIVTTIDSGTTWQNYGNSFSSNRINYILPFTENEIMLGAENGIIYTSDHGTTWQFRNNGLIGNPVIYQLQNQSGQIYASTSSGLYLSSDMGNQWIHYNDYSYQHQIYSCILSTDLLLAATDNGIFKIEPNGWVSSSSGIYEFTPISLNTTQNDILIYNTSSGLFKSTDNGNSWSTLEFENFYDGCTFICKDSIYFVQNMAYDFFLSSDFGNTWISTGEYWGYNTCMSFSKDDYSIFAGFYHSDPQPPPSVGFRQSTDFGISWLTRSGIGIVGVFLEIVSIPGMLFTYANDIYYYNGDLGIYRSNNDGVSWIETNTGLTSKQIKYITNDKYFNLYTSLNDGIYKLNKTNYAWHPYTNDYSNVTFINFDKFNNIIIINDGKLYASVNGSKWEYASNGLDSQIVNLIESDSSGYFYVADNHGRLYKTLTPHLIDQLPSVPLLVSPINNQQVSTDTVKLVWNSSSPLVMKYNLNLSSDSLFNDFLDTLVTDTSLIVFNLSANKKYYWRVKANNEVGWSNFGDVGIFNTNLLATTEIKNPIKEFTLSQNYPNPFNPTTTIKYSTHSQQYVTLKVYDVLGNEVATLVNEEQPAGNYSIEFNGSNLASGMYFYYLKAGEFKATKKLILLK